MTNLRVGSVRPAVYPGLEDYRTGVEVVIVALKILDFEKVSCSETPDGALSDGTVGFLLINPPIVGRTPLQRPRIVSGPGLATLGFGRGRIGLLHSGAILTEKDVMPRGLLTGKPCQSWCLVCVGLAVCGVGPVRAKRRKGKGLQI